MSRKKGRIEWTRVLLVFFLASALALSSVYLYQQFQTKHIKEYAFSQLQDAEVNLPTDFLQVLSEEFINSPDEYVYCYQGIIDNTTITITDYYKPTITEATPISLRFEHCDRPSTIGTVHNHLNGVCGLSLEDAHSMGVMRHPTIGIICGRATIAFFTTDNLERSAKVKIV